MKRFHCAATLLVAPLLLAMWSMPAAAAVLQFEAFLDGSQEVPPNAAPGVGDSSLTLDDSTGDWTLTGNFSGLLAATTAAHIHGPALPGVNAGVIAALTVTPATSGTLSGAGTFTAPQMADLIAGKYYVNVHTSVFAGGEIRGQLNAVPEPASVTLLGMGGLVAAAAVWRRRRHSK